MLNATTARARGRFGFLLFGFAVGVAAATIASAHAGTAQPERLPAGVPGEVQRRLQTEALPWVPNAGQWDPVAAFRAQTFAGTAWVTRDGRIVHQFNSPDIEANVRRDRKHDACSPGECAAGMRRGWILSESFVGGRAPAAIHGVQERPGRASFSIGGDPARHRSGLATFGVVDLGEIFPGVNVRLKAAGANVEKLFTVASGADPAAIRMRLDGATRLSIAGDGTLEAATDNGPIRFSAPVAFQTIDGRHTEVGVRYVLDAARAEYGFALAGYDPRHPVTIDPVLAATYAGGSALDEATSLAVHPVSGEIIVTGYTSSGTDFPGTANGADPDYNAGTHDAFVVRFDRTLATRLQSTYFGGTSDDTAYGVAVHPHTGDIYIVGYTNSATLPGTGSAPQPNHTAGGNWDGFVARFNASLTLLQGATFVGGASDDYLLAIAIHPNLGDVFIAGYTVSSDYPQAANGAQSTIGIGTGIVLTRLNSALTTFVQSTYLRGTGAGSTGLNQGYAIAIHPGNGDIYVTGFSTSNAFIGIDGNSAQLYQGMYDTVVARVSPTLKSVVQSTYAGGADDDVPAALAINPATGEVYVGGRTASNPFPGTTGGAQAGSGGGTRDGFIVRFNAGLTSRLQSTYVSGDLFNEVNGLAVHPATGHVFAAGATSSLAFPGVQFGSQQGYGGGVHDGFISVFNSALTTRFQSTYFGSNGDDGILALAVHPATFEILTAGYTAPLTLGSLPGTPSGAQSTHGGGFDGFVARHSMELGQFATASPFSFDPRLNVAPGSLQVSGPAAITGIGLSSVSIIGGNFAQFCVSSGPDCNCDVTAYTNAAATITMNRHVCVRQAAPLTVPAAAEAYVFVGGTAATYLVTTGNNAAVCSLDVDGNGAIDAATDGLMILRAMFGLTGTAVTGNAIGGGTPSRADWNSIRAYLNANCGTNFLP